MENSIYLDKGISIHPRHDGIIEIRKNQNTKANMSWTVLIT